MHVGLQLWHVMPLRCVDVENRARSRLRASRVGAVGCSEPAVFQGLPGVNGVIKAGLGERRVRPSLQTVVAVEECLPVTDQMKMNDHAFDYLMGVTLDFTSIALSCIIGA